VGCSPQISLLAAMQAMMAFVMAVVFVVPAMASATEVLDTLLMDAGQFLPHEEDVTERAEAAYEAAMATVAGGSKHESTTLTESAKLPKVQDSTATGITQLHASSSLVDSNGKGEKVIPLEWNGKVDSKQAASKARMNREMNDLMIKRMKEVPPWALKEFKSVLGKERALHASAEALVQNLTNAMQLTTGALKEKERALQETNDARQAEFHKLEEHHKETEKQTQDMKTQLKAANALAQQLQDKLNVHVDALANERKAASALRDRNGGYASHCQQMMADMHSTLKDERVTRVAAEKKAADLKLKLVHSSQREGDLKPKFTQSKHLLQQRDSENANLTAALKHADVKLATMGNKLQILAKASQETTQRLRLELEKIKIEKRKVVVTKTKGTMEEDKLNKQLAQKLRMSENIIAKRKKAAGVNHIAYMKLRAETQKLHAEDTKLKTMFVKQHKTMEALKQRAMHAERMVAAEHREMMSNKLEKLAAEKHLKKLAAEVAQARKLAVRLNMEKKIAEKANAKIKVKGSAMTKAMTQLKEESKALDEARQVLKETYGALHKETKDSKAAHKKIHELMETLNHKKVELKLNEDARNHIKEQLQATEKQNKELESKQALDVKQLKELTAKLAKANALNESEAKESLALHEQVAAALKKEEKARAQLVEEQQAARQAKSKKMVLEAAALEKSKELEAKLASEDKKVAQARHTEHTMVDVTRMYNSEKVQLDRAKEIEKVEEHKTALVSYENAQDERKIHKLSAALIKVSNENKEMLNELPELAEKNNLRGTAFF